MMKLRENIIAIVCLVLIRHVNGNNLQSNKVFLNIQDSTSGQAIPSTMHGAILETNINRGDDGGLYAELIYNRAFQGNRSSSSTDWFSPITIYFLRKRSIIGWLVNLW